MHSLLETRVDRTLGGEEPVQTFVHRLEPGVGLLALRLAHGRPSLGQLGISREAMRSTAAALLPQRADARSPQLVLAPRGRCAPAGRPPALSDCQPRPPDFVAGELYGMGMRAALAVVTAAGVAAAALILALPRLAASSRILRFRLGRWLGPRTTSRRAAAQAWTLVSACWLVRAVAVFLLLGTLGVGFSFPLALLFLCAAAAAAALPIGPAGAATQVGASGAALIGSGGRASKALAIAVSVGALGVFSGAAILLFAVAWRNGLSLVPARAGA